MMDVGNEDTGVVGVAGSISDRSGGEHVPVETIRLGNKARNGMEE